MTPELCQQRAIAKADRMAVQAELACTPLAVLTLRAGGYLVQIPQAIGSRVYAAGLGWQLLEHDSSHTRLYLTTGNDPQSLALKCPHTQRWVMVDGRAIGGPVCGNALPSNKLCVDAGYDLRLALSPYFAAIVDFFPGLPE